jgi:hypothetical protein
VAFSNVPEREGGRMPDFCIIGAAKAGTTALNGMLDRHPDLFMNPLKEPNYFSTEAIGAFGAQWYRGLCRDARPDQLCGEASTSYTRYPLVAGTAERMAAANPEMRLIYLLREPVARVEAECLQILKYSRHVLGDADPVRDLDAFLEAIETPEHPYHSATVASSRYIDQIEAFEAVFPADRMLIVMQDDLQRDAEATLRRICGFLGVPPLDASETGRSANVTARFLSGLDRQNKTDRLRRLPFYRTAKSLLSREAKARILDLLPGKPAGAELRLSEATRNRLREAFAEPNRRLEARLGSLPPDWHR